MNKIKVEINGKEYELLLAISEEEKEQGLKDVESMEDNEGMFFDYRDDVQEEVGFWMQDTEIPLDIIFVGEDNEVISVAEGIPLSEDILSESNVAYVIELNAHSGVNAGDEVIISDEKELIPNKMFILNPDGTPQFELQGGERIFSRKSSKVIISKAKRAHTSNSDSDYKSLGRYIFKELDAQTSRDPEYVDLPDKED